jgi:hypothetical protein
MKRKNHFEELVLYGRILLKGICIVFLYPHNILVYIPVHNYQSYRCTCSFHCNICPGERGRQFSNSNVLTQKTPLILCGYDLEVMHLRGMEI